MLLKCCAKVKNKQKTPTRKSETAFFFKQTLFSLPFWKRKLKLLRVFLKSRGVLRLPLIVFIHARAEPSLKGPCL